MGTVLFANRTVVPGTVLFANRTVPYTKNRRCFGALAVLVLFG